jgi:hypothetical protein
MTEIWIFTGICLILVGLNALAWALLVGFL